MSISSDKSLPDDDQRRAKRLVQGCQLVREQLSQVVVGQDDVVEQLLIAILARGHCLLEGVPGLAKTLMVRSLAETMRLTFHRIQFTPDLMPADITGTDIIQVFYCYRIYSRHVYQRILLIGIIDNSRTSPIK